MEPAAKRARTLADVPIEVQRTVHAFVGGAHGATPRRLFLQQVRSSARRRRFQQIDNFAGAAGGGAMLADRWCRTCGEPGHYGWNWCTDCGSDKRVHVGCELDAYGWPLQPFVRNDFHRYVYEARCNAADGV